MMKTRLAMLWVLLLLLPQNGFSESLQDTLAAPSFFTCKTFSTATKVSSFTIDAEVDIPPAEIVHIPAIEVSLLPFTEDNVVTMTKAIGFSNPNNFSKEEIEANQPWNPRVMIYSLNEGCNSLNVVDHFHSNTNVATAASAEFQMVPGPGNAEYGVYSGQEVYPITETERTSESYLESEGIAKAFASQIAPELELIAIGIAESNPLLTVSDTDRLNQNEAVDIPEETPLSFLFTFGHLLNGIPVTFTNEWGSGSDESHEPYTDFYQYEQLCLVIAEGSIAYWRYDSPYHIGNAYMSDYGELLPFEQIIEIAKTILPLKYASSEIEILQSAVYNIQRIAFGYTRVMMPNEPERCILVPAWDFFGEYCFTYKDGRIIQYPGKYKSLLTIDAVHGNVIDRVMGY